MSNSLNIDVLVSAKHEYTNQLVHLLSPRIYVIIKNVYNESQIKKKKRSISLRNFQICLKQIPNWNSITIDNHINSIKQNIPYLLDLITAIFISHIKILASVRLKDTDKSVQVKVPNLDFFLHKIIITIAEKIYYNPKIILESKENIILVIENIIEDSIRNQIPLDKILTEYLEGVFNKETEVENAISLKSLEESQYGSRDNNYNNFKKFEPTVPEDGLKDGPEEGSEEGSEESEDHLSVVDDECKHVIPTRPIPTMLNNENKEKKILFGDAKPKLKKEPKEQDKEQSKNQESESESESEPEIIDDSDESDN